jgi:hypothetical protein
VLEDGRTAVRDDQGTDPTPGALEPGRRRKFSFNFSLGRRPANDTLSPDGTRSAADVRELNIEFSDGKLRVHDGDRVTGEDKPARTEDEAREAEMWERLEHIGTGAYPDTARLHRALRTVVLVLGLSVPIALLVVGLASGQSTETIVFMTLFGLIVGAMFASSFPGRR